MTSPKNTRDTRSQILIAAAQMLGENPTSGLSVRAVAARAGVSTGSVQHFFPTQRALLDTVIAGLYDLDVPEDPIQQTHLSPQQRLVACLRLLLDQYGSGEQARAYWVSIHKAYVVKSPSRTEVETFFALERLSLHYIERWLLILAKESTCNTADIEQKARFLYTIINGLFLERVLPSEGVPVERENQTLQMAASAVLMAT